MIETLRFVAPSIYKDAEFTHFGREALWGSLMWRQKKHEPCVDLLAHTELGDGDMAFNLITDAITLWPDSPELFLVRAMFLMTTDDQERLELAEEDGAIAVALDPSCAEAYYRRAKTRSCLSNTRGAIADMRECILSVKKDPLLKDRLCRAPKDLKNLEFQWQLLVQEHQKGHEARATAAAAASEARTAQAAQLAQHAREVSAEKLRRLRSLELDAAAASLAAAAAKALSAENHCRRGSLTSGPFTSSALKLPAQQPPAQQLSAQQPPSHRSTAGTAVQPGTRPPSRSRQPQFQSQKEPLLFVSLPPTCGSAAQPPQMGSSAGHRRIQVSQKAMWRLPAAALAAARTTRPSTAGRVSGGVLFAMPASEQPLPSGAPSAGAVAQRSCAATPAFGSTLSVCSSIAQLPQQHPSADHWTVSPRSTAEQQPPMPATAAASVCMQPGALPPLDRPTPQIQFMWDSLVKVDAPATEPSAAGHASSGVPSVLPAPEQPPPAEAPPAAADAQKVLAEVPETAPQGHFQFGTLPEVACYQPCSFVTLGETEKPVNSNIQSELPPQSEAAASHIGADETPTACTCTQEPESNSRKAVEVSPRDGSSFHGSDALKQPSVASPRSPDLLLGRAMLHISAGNIQAAELDAAKALVDYPCVSDSHCWRQCSDLLQGLHLASATQKVMGLLRVFLAGPRDDASLAATAAACTACAARHAELAESARDSAELAVVEREIVSDPAAFSCEAAAAQLPCPLAVEDSDSTEVCWELYTIEESDEEEQQEAEEVGSSAAQIFESSDGSPVRPTVTAGDPAVSSAAAEVEVGADRKGERVLRGGSVMGKGGQEAEGAAGALGRQIVGHRLQLDQSLD
ncbi:hypothetical protein COCSUDRAFT_45456 [Coccomyxa subellipsoidea C-169]|uniref:TPR-like protein n=1 Tax=Coccomyxa subellipsoidea (strain C-169) TaxID=574566 RepID=I0YJ51_COCSC|nr:hypothetical protein COCSUDRAFT_45456 [Coccomyxa subellipsoidea C-169]EIE18420.1 hypothetical protein COCSUDRAFT_45456 [Coccomyxa subellipsoidea C-169]|eukprot:XP_005642964.1 hypothetical protein COCSUDRAFT_45456 [Coccomyxa subellipsoidea C-169]